MIFSDNLEIERHPLEKFRLTSDACLGDTFVGAAIPFTIRASHGVGRKGFGKKSNKDVGKDKGDWGGGYICDVIHGSTKGGLTLQLGLHIREGVMYYNTHYCQTRYVTVHESTHQCVIMHIQVQ